MCRTSLHQAPFTRLQNITARAIFCPDTNVLHYKRKHFTTSQYHVICAVCSLCKGSPALPCTLSKSRKTAIKHQNREMKKSRKRKKSERREGGRAFTAVVAAFL